MQEMETFYDEMEDENFLVDETEIQRILVEYHRKQMIENLTGPGVSLVLHVVMLTVMFVFIVSKPKLKEPELIINIAQLKDIQIDPAVIEDIPEPVVQPIEDQAPVTDPTNAPTDTVGAVDSLRDISDDAPMSDDDSDTQELLDVVRTNSPLKFSGPLSGRSEAGRADLVGTYGGTHRGQQVLCRALDWLARVQNENGSWGNGDGDPAHTGLALLTFLGHGETPLSKRYGKTVQKAMRWVANYANSDQMNRSRAYSHGIAAYAISESYAMTKIPFLRSAMEKAITRIIDGQQSGGGFDYHYKKGERWDVSVTSWQAQALKAARVAGSTNERLKSAIARNIKFFRGAAYNESYKKFMYATGKQNSSLNLTGAGCVALQLLGASRSPQVKGALQTIGTTRLEAYREVAQHPSKWREVGGEKLYGWYYDTQAIFNSHKENKALWREWHSVFEKVLIRAQSREGYWETNGKHKIGSADIPGRVLATCLCALQFEVYYRYLPTFNINKMDAAAVQDMNGGIDEVGVAPGKDGIIIEVD